VDGRTSFPSVDAADVARFDALGEDWWDPAGSMAPLHAINPLRIGWLRDTMARRFDRDPTAPLPLSGLTILDVGCGAGLLSEPLSRLGARVTGIDPAEGAIAVARGHALETGASVTYRAGSVEELADEGLQFDVVLAMEVVEHARDAPAFLDRASSLVRPRGLFAASTLNRTLKSFMLAIVGAEYLLRWLPRGTHHWEQFVTPEEMVANLRAAGLREYSRTGIVFDPLQREWRLSRDTAVNYMIAAVRR
jgi:2-polyprenyl-6-hydroxyphenyl methylase/3-demethylubiquinone-9 3-methyltransferase